MVQLCLSCLNDVVRRQLCEQGFQVIPNSFWAEVRSNRKQETSAVAPGKYLLLVGFTYRALPGTMDCALQRNYL